MRTLLILVILFFSINGAKAQTYPVLDSIISITKRHSIYSNNVEWDKLEYSIYKAVLTNETDTFKAIKPAISLMLDEMGDNHSYIQYGKSVIERANKVDLIARINKPTIEAVQKSKPTEIRTHKFSNNVGYIQLPGMNIAPEDATVKINELGQLLRDALCSLNPEKLNGIIVDLRLNTGGNMYPMLAGIAPLLGDGLAGSFVKNGAIMSNWEIHNGNIFSDNKQITAVKNNCSPNKTIKIAVLVGAATGSSGEVTAISFIGKNNTRLFGEPTAGLVSANAQMKVNEQIYYYISSAYIMDRNGTEYKSSINPHVQILNGDDFENLDNDAKVIGALKWIKAVD